MSHFRQNNLKRRSDSPFTSVNQPMCYLLICAFVMIQPVQTAAFIPPGTHILESMIRNMGSCKSLSATQEVTGLSEHPAPVTEVLRFLSSGNIRIDRTAENFQQIILFQSGIKRTVENGVSQEMKLAFADRYLDLLVYRNMDLLESRLAQYPIDISVSSLGRFEGKPMWIIGEIYPDETRPQIWVDKDSMLPFRILFVETGNGSLGSRIDIRFMDWKPVQATWYPFKILIYRNKSQVVTINIQHVDIDVTMPADTFERQTGRNESPQPSEPEGYIRSQDMDAVKKTIDRLKQQLNTD
ncbi:MAG: hypothetical protein WA151_12660 [Desulfatirhabdiaceae bacterium]